MLIQVHGINLNSPERFRGDTPLHYVVNTEVALALIQAVGINVDIPNGFDQTPLHLAVKNNRAGIAYELIKAKANVNATDKGSCTPLHWAARICAPKWLHC